MAFAAYSSELKCHILMQFHHNNVFRVVFFSLFFGIVSAVELEDNLSLFFLAPFMPVFVWTFGGSTSGVLST